MNLSQMFSQEQKREELQLEFPLEKLGEDRVKEASPLFLSLENIGKAKVEIKGSCDLSFDLSCDRCLSTVPTKLSLSFQRIVYGPEIEVSDEEADQDYMDGYELDLSRLLEEELQLCWPTKILCHEDCKGICMVCGQNLNEKSCGCDTFVPDVRFADLLSLLPEVEE